MTNEHTLSRLSDYLDGELAPREAKEVEAHLDGCPECSRVLDELRAVVAAAGELPDVPPDRDLWPAIEARLAPRTDAPDRAPAQVVPLRGHRGVTMTVPQLIAAAVALVLFSGSAVWMTLGGTGPIDANPTLYEPDSPVTTVAFTDFDRVIADLEEEYLSRRAELDPGTIQVVERNLAIIDQAIREAREALSTDPSSEFISAHLANAMRQKMGLLRQAAMIAQTET
jgi:hypothetical protein